MMGESFWESDAALESITRGNLLLISSRRCAFLRFLGALRAFLSRHSEDFDQALRAMDLARMIYFPIPISLFDRVNAAAY